MLDEGLEILNGLWSGKAIWVSGEYYQVKKCTFLPTPIQIPRIPIWVGGFWPHKRPFRRAARWDGAFPLNSGGPFTPPPDNIAGDPCITSQNTAKASNHLTWSSWAPLPETTQKPAGKSWLDMTGTGLTWWLESLFRWRNSIEAMRQRIRQGPPRKDLQP